MDEDDTNRSKAEEEEEAEDEEEEIDDDEEAGAGGSGGGEGQDDDDDEEEDEEEEEVPPPKGAEEPTSSAADKDKGGASNNDKKPTVLNIPKVSHPSSSEAGASTSQPSATTSADPDSIGEFDDGRSGKVTLSSLIQEGLVDPGDGVLTIEYLGQTFKGDLLSVGKIRSQETGLMFNNPSAWAIYCKKIVNPAKKSGCGWASVKYKGRKMDHFKNLWTKMKTQRDAEEAERRSEEEKKNASAAAAAAVKAAEEAGAGVDADGAATTTGVGAMAGVGGPASSAVPVPVLLHSQLGPKLPPGVTLVTSAVGANPAAPAVVPALPPVDPESPIEAETFGSQGRLQPFTMSVSSSAMLLVDIHAHTSRDSVCGYLAGHWDLNIHNLAVTHAFPCLVDPFAPSVKKGPPPDDDEAGDEDDDEEADAASDAAVRTELDIYNKIYGKHLTLIGWYKSCPKFPRALPSVKDSESQLDFQVKLLGNSDATYTPCVGLAVKPFANLQNESDLCFYWVIPPPENSPQEYGKPMKMQHSTVTDPCLSQDLLDQIDEVIAFYNSGEKRATDFSSDFNSDTKLITKMGRSLLPKFPRDQDDRLWRHIRCGLLGRDKHEELSPDPLISHSVFSASATNGGGVVAANGFSNGYGDAEDEEEIDDDEDGAIMRRSNGGRRGSRALSTHSNNSSSGGGGLSGVLAAAAAAAARQHQQQLLLQQQQQQQPASGATDEVISLLLQRQAPVAPAAHSSSSALSAAAPDDDDEDAPLDFSKH